MEQKALEENLGQSKATVLDRLSAFVELAGDVYLLYKNALPEEKRELLEIATSNRIVYEKNLVITLSPPFREVAERCKFSNGSPTQGERLVY